MVPAPGPPAALPPRKRGRKAKADAGLNVCLDFLKGKCARDQCRFVHPDLTAYQQLSEAVEAQAGREICEVWAMTGQCKFGAKCNKLHPATVSPAADQAGPAVAPAPAVAAPPTPMGPAAAEADLAAEFERFAECMRRTLGQRAEEPRGWQPPSEVAVAGEDTAEEQSREAPTVSVAQQFLHSVLGLDSALVDIFWDLNLVAC
eukprot:EG_transcript_13524